MHAKHSGTVAVTGASGFIGSRLLRQLLISGLTVRALVRRPLQVQDPAVSSVLCDFTDVRGLERALHGCIAVVHLAAKVPGGGKPDDEEDAYSDSARLTRPLIEAARRAAVPKFVFGGSWAVYRGGSSTRAIDESFPTEPSTSYGRGKLEAERYVLEGLRHSSTRPVVLRISNVLGERPSQDGVILNFIRRASSGQSLDIYGDGSDVRDYLYVEDVGRAITCAVLGDPTEEIINVGSGKPTSVIDITRSITKLYAEFGIAVGPVRFVQPHHEPVVRYLDVSKARRVLGFVPEISLNEGIKRTVLWWERRRLRPVKGVILDVDGTLLDVSDRYYRGYEAAVRPFGLPAPPRDVIVRLKHDDASGLAILAHLYPGLPETLRCDIDELRVDISNSRPLMRRDRLVHDVLPTLARLRDAGLRIALVTLRPPKSNSELFRNGIIGAVDFIVNARSGDKVPALLEAARRLGLPTFCCIAVGDAPVDIRAANACGMRSIAAGYGLVSGSRLLHESPDASIRAFSEIPHTIKALCPAAQRRGNTEIHDLEVSNVR
jgi:UDP-glucose 4-epimerase